MSKTKYLLIFGTRPEAIKMAPVILALKQTPQAECVVCVTGQHEELLSPVLSLFGIIPSYSLHSMSNNQQPCKLLARMLPELEKVICREKPDWVLVQGDTMSALAGAMAACYAKVRLAHIEAGIRSHNKLEPFPEEVNRKLISVMADVHFAATSLDKEALIQEGHNAQTIHVTGNTCIDAMRLASELPFSPRESVLEIIPPSNRQLILVTIHRRENHGVRLESICRAIETLAIRYSDSVHFLLPVHPNPSVSGTVKRLLGGLENVSLVPPLGYQEMIAVAGRCHFAMIDSGGLQEELPSLGKPALILRQVTDRCITIGAGAAMLVGADPEAIISAFTKLMEDPALYREMALHRNLFGDGTAAQTIASLLNSGQL